MSRRRRKCQTRFKQLSLADWVVIVIFLIGIGVAVYTVTLRHA